MNTTYRSIFSGQEIDEAIAAMKNSVNGIIVSNTFDGGAEKAASAELAKILKAGIDALNDPANLQSIVDQAPGYSSFTDADRIKFDRTKIDFRGSFLNATDRANTIGLDTDNYLGHEISILFDNGQGSAELSKWNTTTHAWEPVRLSGEVVPIVTTGTTTIPLFHFDATKYNTLKCIVSVGNATQRQVQEILITVIGPDVYMSIYGDVGNATLFNATSSLTAGVAYVNITTLVAGVTVTGKHLSLI